MTRILLVVYLSVFCFDADAKVEEISVINNRLENISWVRRPNIQFSDDELQGYDRTVIVGFSTNERGFITSAQVEKSSGLDELDNKVLLAIKRAKTKPYQINGVSHPIVVKQPFTMMLSRKVEFEIKPKIIANRTLLLEMDRSVGIYSEADENGNVTKAEVSESSMLPELDAYVLSEFKRQTKFKPLRVNGKPYPIKDTSWFYFSKKLNIKD